MKLEAKPRVYVLAAFSLVVDTLSLKCSLGKGQFSIMIAAASFCYRVVLQQQRRMQ
jgi:hypothetical protein